MPPKEKYTDPKLRDEVKEELHNSDKGGQPGQWSARKAQLMAKEYKERGGDYNTEKSEKDKSQQNLSNWGDEEWQTKDGSGQAKEDDGTEHRYLPKKAWEDMTEEEKEKTDQKKVENSKEGKQHVENTSRAKQSRKKASKDTKQKNGEGKEDDGDDQQDDAEDDDGEEKEYVDDGEADEGQDGEDDGSGEDEGENDDDQENAQPGQKRKQSPSKKSNGQSKSQKQNDGKGKQSKGETVGSKHQSAEEPAPKGSVDRLPKKGQEVQWKALPGYVKGTVEEIVTEEKEVDGKQVKGSEKDPRIVLKSSSSGKIAVHKPDACFYE